MRQSQYFIPTLKEAPKHADALSHKYLLKGGYVKQTASGVYTYLPLGLTVIENIKKIIRQELNSFGCAEVQMPIMQPKELWDESGRWDIYGDEMMRLKDRHNRDFCLGPTHEEVVTDLVRDWLNSYKKLPLCLYQIQNKYRDEMRPRFGLMRGREFIMKDAYSFHDTKESLNEWYDLFFKAYTSIFNKMELNFRPVKADTGEIGGDDSYEFMALSEIGEDTIIYADGGDFAVNQEVMNLEIGEISPDGIGVIQHAKGIEIGQVFQLGTKYSSSMNAHYTNKEGQMKPYYMGCYGIGVSRVMMAVLEQHIKDDRIIWPTAITPFDKHIIIGNTKSEELVNKAHELYQHYMSQGLNVLIDDRDDRIGSKLKDADLIGATERVIFGRDFNEGFVEVFDNHTGEALRIQINTLF